MASNTEVWQRALVPLNATIGQAIQNLNETAVKIVLVTNEFGELQGTLSDGDIRRGLLKGLDLSSPIVGIIHRNALVAPPALGRELVMKLMTSNKVQQIPVVDERYHVVGLHLWDEVISLPSRSNLMVIMAGGAGK